jgi:serine/threonine protein phosphatase PrpC
MSVSHVVTSHPGKVRSHNEDCWAADDATGLFVVADGMGGVDAGEVASAIARDRIVQVMAEGGDLSEAVQQAHGAILDASARGIGARGMGTTIVAATVTDRRYRIAWVGDSRAYLWDGGSGTLSRLTRDHSQVELLLARGLITPEQAHRHPQKNLITQALGQSGLAKLEVGLVEGALVKGQSLLLCSDGLSDELTDQAIADQLAAARTPRLACQGLQEAAIAEGGRDNITMILVSGGASGLLSRFTVPKEVLFGVAGGVLALLALIWVKYQG